MAYWMVYGFAKIKGTPDVARKSFFEVHANIMPYLKFCCTNPTRGSSKIFRVVKKLH